VLFRQSFAGRWLVATVATENQQASLMVDYQVKSSQVSSIELQIAQHKNIQYSVTMTGAGRRCESDIQCRISTECEVLTYDLVYDFNLDLI